MKAVVEDFRLLFADVEENTCHPGIEVREFHATFDHVVKDLCKNSSDGIQVRLSDIWPVNNVLGLEALIAVIQYGAKGHIHELMRSFQLYNGNWPSRSLLNTTPRAVDRGRRTLGIFCWIGLVFVGYLEGGVKIAATGNVLVNYLFDRWNLSRDDIEA